MAEETSSPHSPDPLPQSAGSDSPVSPSSPERDKSLAETAALMESSQRAWQDFWEQHGQARLLGEAHYSLPPDLLDILESKVPGLLTAEALTFERAFHAAASFGVFQGQPLGDSAHPPADVLVAARAAAGARQRIQDMLDEDRRANGVESYDLTQAAELHQHAFDVTSQKRQGYVGWLMSEAQFRAELATLRSATAGTVQSRGRFPTRFELVWSLRTDPDPPSAFSLLLDFYSRWSLERLLTWDWPVPLGPRLSGIHSRIVEPGTATGLSLFLPWSVLQGKQLAADELIAALKTIEAPLHLRGWINPAPQDSKKKTADSYQVWSQLYRYYWLGLRSRYQERFHNRLQKIDEAFGVWLKLERDTITRVRNQVENAINPAGRPSRRRKVRRDQPKTD